MYDLREFIRWVCGNVENHRMSSGGYARWTKQNDKNNRDLGINVYGTANVINIYYTCNMMQDNSWRRHTAEVLQKFQDKETGLLEGDGLNPIHTTAFVSGALELVDEKLLCPITALEKYKDKEELWSLLDSIDWAEQPWVGSHKGAGIYGAMVLNGYGDVDWQNNYFEWFANNADEQTGLWKKGCITDKIPFFHYLASTFHYIFNFEYAKRPIPYPQQLTKTCIDAYDNGKCAEFGKGFGYNEIDFLYMLNHAQRRCGKYFDDVQRITEEIADKFFKNLLSTDWENSLALDDLHTLFAVMSAAAMIQEALPGKVITDKPLRLVIDRRPFL